MICGAEKKNFEVCWKRQSKAVERGETCMFSPKINFLVLIVYEQMKRGFWLITAKKTNHKTHKQGLRMCCEYIITSKIYEKSMKYEESSSWNVFIILDSIKEY